MLCFGCIPYRLNEVKRIWRHNRCLSRPSLIGYEYWLRRFAAYCEAHSRDQRTELTQRGAERFARWWRSHGSRRRGRLKGTIAASHGALRAWAFALSLLGEALSPWREPRPEAALDHRWQAFADYLRDVRGNPAITIRKKLTQLRSFDRYRRSRGSAGRPVRLLEIDAYIVACRHRFTRTTVADICSTIRSYLRYLHATGAMKADLAASVMAPAVRTAKRPYRALPWDDVQRILRAIDRTTPRAEARRCVQKHGHLWRYRA